MRKLYEYLNIYIYIILPILFTAFYWYLESNKIFSFANISNYIDYSFEFILATLGVLLTLLGLMFSLPNNTYRKLMKKYKHDEIIYNTIFLGIIVSILFVFLFFVDMLPALREYLFVIVLIELCISSFWIFKTLKFISQDST